jgi:8-oxo-dGTP diphosphatase
MLQVVAAVIERAGAVLICRRRPDQSHPLKWEFPGGKVEPGETPAQALARELEEELGICGAAGEEMALYPVAYPGRAPIELIFMRVRSYTGAPRNLIFQEMRWAPVTKLTEFDFIEGDLRFIHEWADSILVHMASAIKMMDPSQDEFLAGLESKSRRPNHFFRTMANRPEVLKTFVPFYGAVVGPGSVERRIKELVYLACSYANRCAYCTAAHTASSGKAGITKEELRALQTEQDHSFSEPERAAIQYARDLTQTADARESRAALPEHFTSEQIVEITLVAAMANFTNRFNNGLEVMPEG